MISILGFFLFFLFFPLFVDDSFRFFSISKLYSFFLCFEKCLFAEFIREQNEIVIVLLLFFLLLLLFSSLFLFFSSSCEPNRPQQTIPERILFSSFSSFFLLPKRKDCLSSSWFAYNQIGPGYFLFSFLFGALFLRLVLALCL